MSSHSPNANAGRRRTDNILFVPRSWLRRYDILLLILTIAMLFLWPRLWPNILSSEMFMPHGECYMWIPQLVWLHLISDTLIGLSYVSISTMLAYLVYRARRDIPFHWIFLAFGLFIVACGGTHFMEILTMWSAMFWLSGYVKLVTAVASVATAVVLPPLIPKTLRMVRDAKLSSRRKQELESANKELEAFSYSVSHDLRAPLRTIDGFSQILLEDYADKLDDEGRDYLQRMRVASQHMATLIDDMLNLSRVTRSEMSHDHVNLSALAHKIIEGLQQANPERRVNVKIEDNLLAEGDERLLRIALENLLNNAWKFTSRRDDATIEFGRTKQDEETAFYVRDNGAGFDMAYVDKLFGVFQRLHAANDFEGTGIGLATVQRIISRHGGRIWAEGAVDKGATFYFTL